MKKRCFVIACLFCFILAFSSIQAQDVEKNVSEYGQKIGTLYLQPLVDTFGANLNSGIFQGAKVDKWGIHLQVGIVGMGAFVSEDQKTFTPVDEGDIHPEPGKVLPTIFGSTEPVTWPGVAENLPGGVWDTKIVPFAVPQLTIGSIMGTEAVVRWIELNINEDIGKVRLFGIGGRHSLSQYIPLIPVDIAVGYFWQNFKIGDIIKAHASYLGLQAGYSLSVLHFYGGIGYERATLDVHYEQEADGQTEPFVVNFSMESANKTRFTLGLMLNFPILKIYADYNFAAQNTFTAGIRFGI